MSKSKERAELYKAFLTQDRATARFNVAFKVKGRIIFAHRKILMSASEYFQCLLSIRWNRTRKSAIVEDHYGYNDFKDFLEFLYAKTCKVNPSNVRALLDMAEYHLVFGLKDYCQKVAAKWKLTCELAIDLFPRAHIYGLDALCTACTKTLYDEIKFVPESEELAQKMETMVAIEIIKVSRSKKTDMDVFRFAFDWVLKVAKMSVEPTIQDETCAVKAVIKEIYHSIKPHVDLTYVGVGEILKYVVQSDAGFTSEERNEIRKTFYHA